MQRAVERSPRRRLIAQSIAAAMFRRGHVRPISTAGPARDHPRRSLANSAVSLAQPDELQPGP